MATTAASAKKHSGLSCEIVRTYARIRSLTTGTFNRVVKDRIAFRLSGAFSVQANFLWARAPTRIRLSSKPYKHTLRAKTLSMQHPTEFPRVFHREGGREATAGELNHARSRFLTGLSARFGFR